MWEIWANLLLPKVLKSCPKSNKSPNLVTLSPEVQGDEGPLVSEAIATEPHHCPYITMFRMADTKALF